MQAQLLLIWLGILWAAEQQSPFCRATLAGCYTGRCTFAPIAFLSHY